MHDPSGNIVGALFGKYKPSTNCRSEVLCFSPTQPLLTGTGQRGWQVWSSRSGALPP